MNNPNLNKLKKEWYKKLKDEGFEDIEKDDSKRVKRTDAIIQRKTTDQIQQAQDYYAMARSLMQHYEFEDEFDEKVWSLHSEGVSIRAIAKSMNVNGDNGYIRRKISKTIKRLELIMKVNYITT